MNAHAHPPPICFFGYVLAFHASLPLLKEIAHACKRLLSFLRKRNCFRIPLLSNQRRYLGKKKGKKQHKNRRGCRDGKIDGEKDGTK